MSNTLRLPRWRWGRATGWFWIPLLLSGCGGGGSAPMSESLNIPSSGLYVSTQYDERQLAVHSDVEYSRRPNEGGVQYTSDITHVAEQGSAELSLKMDIYVPPNARSTPAPAVVWVHGGGFSGGAKEDTAGPAISYARGGYVAATINYRLTPQNNRTSVIRGMAIQQATEDAMNAVRFLKVHAATYHLDPDRIAVIGTSAGGGISLINAVEYDSFADVLSDYPGVSSQVAAAISTGATLFSSDGPGYPFGFDANDTPIMLFHANPTDSSTGTTWEGSVVPTAQAVNDSGNTCTTVAQPDMTHTADLRLDGPWWGDLKPFLWVQLRLADLR